MQPSCRSRGHTGITSGPASVPAGPAEPRRPARYPARRGRRRGVRAVIAGVTAGRVPLLVTGGCRQRWRSSCVIVTRSADRAAPGRGRARVIVASARAARGPAAPRQAARPARPWPACPGTAAAPQPGQPLTEQQSDQDMVDFARCMRSHGVQMSDPVPPGRARRASRIDLPTRDPATGSALRGLHATSSQAIIATKEAGAAAHAAAAELAALTKYARCMRSHDIDMLDPTPAGRAEPRQRARHHATTSAGTRRSSGRPTRPAGTSCPAGVHDDGTGP